MRMRCNSCGATLRDDAEWCGQCYAPVAPPEIVEGDPVAEEVFAHPEAFRARYRPEFSRWQKSASTFGPLGRIVATLLLLIPVYFFFHAGVIGIVGLAMWLFVVMPMALRSIWQRVPVRSEEDES